MSANAALIVGEACVIAVHLRDEAAEAKQQGLPGIAAPMEQVAIALIR